MSTRLNSRKSYPLNTMGRTDPISFVRGKRGVAGSLVSVCHDRDAFDDALHTLVLQTQVRPPSALLRW